MEILILLGNIHSIISLTLIMKALILLRDIYSIISLTDNGSFDLTEGYLQYRQPDSDNESFDLTEGYLQYHQHD
jgi:hypothetical protein